MHGCTVCSHATGAFAMHRLSSLHNRWTAPVACEALLPRCYQKSGGPAVGIVVARAQAILQAAPCIGNHWCGFLCSVLLSARQLVGKQLMVSVDAKELYPSEHRLALSSIGQENCAPYTPAAALQNKHLLLKSVGNLACCYKSDMYRLRLTPFRTLCSFRRGSRSYLALPRLCTSRATRWSVTVQTWAARGVCISRLMYPKPADVG